MTSLTRHGGNNTSPAWPGPAQPGIVSSHFSFFVTTQKLKRKLFCLRLLRLSAPALLRVISQWMFTDEKWWDLVGPAAYKYVKAGTAMEAKLQNQVCFFFYYLFDCFI